MGQDARYFHALSEEEKHRVENIVNLDIEEEDGFVASTIEWQRLHEIHE